MLFARSGLGAARRWYQRRQGLRLPVTFREALTVVAGQTRLGVVPVLCENWTVLAPTAP